MKYIIMSLIILVCIASLDQAAGSLFPVIHEFYILPVLVATWFVSRRIGVVIAILSITSWFFVNGGVAVLNGQYGFWNALQRLILYLFIVFSVASNRVHLLAKLKESQLKIDQLEGLLLVCSWCKNVRNDKGNWVKMSEYVDKFTRFNSDQCICPDCMLKRAKADAQIQHDSFID